MKNINKVAIFLAARSESKRLPNKHFLKIDKNYKVIDLCILRLKKSKFIKKIFLCTTKRKKDDKFKKICEHHNINLFRGDTDNVLKRFIDCAKKNSIKTIIRITGDCPLIDPNLMDKCINLYLKKKKDYTTNTLKLSYPDGLDVEIVKLSSLIKSSRMSQSAINKEHVTAFIRSSKLFKKYNLKNSKNYSNRRWTLDYKKDFYFLKKVIKFFKPNIFFTWQDIIKAEKNNNFLLNIKKR